MIEQSYIPSLDFIPKKEVKQKTMEERIADTFKSLHVDGNCLELAVMILAASCYVSSVQLEALCDSLLDSHTEKGRIRNGYVKDYVIPSKNNLLKSVCVSTKSVIEKYTKDFVVLFKTADMDDKGFVNRVIDAMNKAECGIDNIIYSLRRYVYNSIVNDKNSSADDPWALADFIVTFLLCDNARQIYLFLCEERLYPFIKTLRPYNIFNGIKFIQQIDKICRYMHIYDSNGKETAYDLEGLIKDPKVTAMIDDIWRVLFSAELADQMFLARDGEDRHLRNRLKSLITLFEQDTDTLDAYKRKYDSSNLIAS